MSGAAHKITNHTHKKRNLPIIISDAIVDVWAVMIEFSDTAIAYFAVFGPKRTNEAACMTETT